MTRRFRKDIIAPERRSHRVPGLLRFLAATRLITCRPDEVVSCARGRRRKFVPFRDCDFTMFSAARSDFLILTGARRLAPWREVLGFRHNNLHSAPEMGLAFVVYTTGSRCLDSPVKNGIAVPSGLLGLLATDRPCFVTVIASVVFFPRAPMRECAAELGCFRFAHLYHPGTDNVPPIFPTESNSYGKPLFCRVYVTRAPNSRAFSLLRQKSSKSQTLNAQLRFPLRTAGRIHVCAR